MGNVEIPEWLKNLPLAPEFRPTDTEFADPIAYISKIEKEASAFGICKVIPPLPKPSKRYVFSNVNKSLLNSRDLGLDDIDHVTDVSKRVKMDEAQGRAVFTTRQQELGQIVGRGKGKGRGRGDDDDDKTVSTAKKQVWQSGEVYTLDEFESKAKGFSRNVLGTSKDVSPLDVEALFWKTAKGKPIYVEYANDVPGSAFGEPEGLLGFFQPRKRRRLIAQCHRGRSYYTRQDVSSSRDACHEVDGPATARDSYASVKKEVTDSSTTASNVTKGSTKSDTARPDVELEGSSGWKLSNSPWNLQVIARSAGSLTRFMLDNIPGVTSPMVYIGMLFSWFAWHVEDHELHSMNFLHTGSPKTWYGIPGDYAFAFEEFIRQQAYGGDVGHLAALKLLGEKTTLLSPEKVVASGIPCCRLVQNPGEFVVSFPRAYHVGFSHGFNCGEAANFGTPQWLTIAKEAAVRRAAMNHLPMLSHQQLLYLLTMSFISRVPESLLPGVRSSRLRDRLKEGRELLVKKAFIDDVLKENNRLNALIGSDSSVRIVLWDPDLLPSFARESFSKIGASGALSTNGADLTVSTNEVADQDIDKLVMFRETVNDLYLGSDDLSHDFQVDSGTLPCVVCGILGYPFMSLVQPSKKFSVDHFLAQQHRRDIGSVGSPLNHSSYTPLCGGGDDISVSATRNDESWDTSGVLRPRIFCLEHAIQIKELLRPQGGSRMLVICHSDYQKIKANATVVAEEIGLSFNYKEIHLETATQKELQLIDIAIDAEELTGVQEDWTSKLGINLRFSAKKGGLSKLGHALNLDCLISVLAPLSRISGIKWWSRRPRTKLDSNHRKRKSSCSDLPEKNEQLHEPDGGTLEKNEQLHEPDGRAPDKNEQWHEPDGRVEAKGKVILQYYRKRFRNR